MEEQRKEISLFPHNETAYVKLCSALENSKCTTINHATGTGKSFIMLKYLYENRNKRVLYISPTYPIINQLWDSAKSLGIDRKELKNVDTMIYRGLLGMDMEKLYEKYDVIVFDEYHRTGAFQTYKKIRELKQFLSTRNDNKKFIGLTATPIRFLDHERNMTEEIFDGNVASSLSLADALLDKLLPVPMYINSKIACRPYLNGVRSAVRKLADGPVKQDFMKKFEEINDEINNGEADNAELIKKYVTEKNGKYIVFCENIEELQKVYKNIDKWFKHIGPVKKYVVHSMKPYEPAVKKARKNNSQAEYDEEYQFRVHEENGMEDTQRTNLGLSKEKKKKTYKRAKANGRYQFIAHRENGMEEQPVEIVQQEELSPEDRLRFNKYSLEDFNNDTEGISVLLCVDILNEGVHVKDIDGVILLRRTQSPIIYFQQIGRALSFSGRKKQIKIFDLVNNFANHDAIAAVYDEVEERIKERLAEDPSKEAEYEEIRKKFVILDETKSIMKRLADIQEEITPEKIIETKVEKAVQDVERYANKENIDLDEALDVLDKYYIYVTNSQLERLQRTKVLLPTELMDSEETRKRILEGDDSIYSHNQKLYNILVTEIIQFIQKNGRIMSKDSEDPREVELCERYFDAIANVKSERRSELRKVLLKAKYQFSCWEKIIFRIKFDESDIAELLKIAHEYVDNGQVIPKRIYYAISTLSLRSNIKNTEELTEVIKKSDDIEKSDRIRRKEERKAKIESVLEAIEEQTQKDDRKIDEDKEEKYKSLSSSDQQYVKSVIREIRRKQYKTLVVQSDETSMDALVAEVKTKGVKNLEEFARHLEEDTRIYSNLMDVLSFMEISRGVLPKADSGSEFEAEVARKLEECLKNEQFRAALAKIKADEGVLSTHTVLIDIIREILNRLEAERSILDLINFFNKHGRRPIINSSDPEEKRIAEEYSKKGAKVLTREQTAILNKQLNTRKSLEATCMSYLENLRKKGGSGR